MDFEKLKKIKDDWDEAAIKNYIKAQEFINKKNQRR